MPGSESAYLRIIAGFVDGCCGVYDVNLTPLSATPTNSGDFRLGKLPIDPSSAMVSGTGEVLCTAHRSGNINLWVHLPYLDQVR